MKTFGVAHSALIALVFAFSPLRAWSLSSSGELVTGFANSGDFETAVVISELPHHRVGLSHPIEYRYNSGKRAWSLIIPRIKNGHYQVGAKQSFLHRVSPGRYETRNGERFEQSSFMVLKPNIEFDLCIRDEHEWCSVFIPALSQHLMCHQKTAFRFAG